MRALSPGSMRLANMVSIPAIPVAGRRRVASFSVLNTWRSRSAVESLISEKVGPDG
jgi:hypothetical protein